MSAFTGEHSFEGVSQKISRHRRTHVLLYGTAKKMMISGSGLHGEVQLRPNDLQEVLRKAATEGCGATQEKVRSHQPVREQSSARCPSSCTPRRVERSVAVGRCCSEKTQLPPDGTSDVWDTMCITPIPRAHEMRSRRSGICSAQGMSPIILLP